MGARVLNRVVTDTNTTPAQVSDDASPWPALFALCLGFFMILVDMTIVTVATPDIMDDLDAEVNSVVWVTSAYLLAYAVPVLITGRLGDRFGPKRLYLAGLTVFTIASLWCGLTGTVEMLIAARVLQGFGAAMMAPQTMAIITRIFPAARRGQAMSLWGATAGVATLVGPLLGGVLVGSLGWEWVFFVNIPVGIVAYVLAHRLVPSLETHQHSFDWLGVTLSGVGMFCLVFGIQEGHQYDWSTISGVITVWRLIIAGIIVLAIFVYWQARNRREPLVPLRLFRDRNFSVSNLAISTMSFAITSIGFPFMLYAQLVRDLSPTRAALLLVPMALVSIVLAPGIGKLIDRVHPRNITAIGFLAASASLFWLSRVMTPEASTWEFIAPMALLGAGSAAVWAPLTATATRNLPMNLAGAGAGVYNATRQVGAVLGSAAIAVLMDARLAKHLPGVDAGPEASLSGSLPEQVHAPFSQAMADAMLLPPAVLLVGFAAVLLFVKPSHER